MNSSLSKFTVTPEAIRPAGAGDRCFYCAQPVGEVHLNSCVLVNKKVRVCLTIEYEVDVPSSWKKENVEFHRNDGAWCSDNLISELEGIIEKTGCLCSVAHFEYLEDTSESFLDEG